jgi:hypothetical protein
MTPCNFYTVVAVATTVLAIAATTTTDDVFGAEPVLAGWHIALTAVCLPLVMAKATILPPGNSPQLEMLVIAVQIINAISLSIYGPGSGQNTVLQQQSMALVLLWIAVFITSLIAITTTPLWKVPVVGNVNVHVEEPPPKYRLLKEETKQ